MKKIIFKCALGCLLLTGVVSCKKQLDINTDPNAPQFIPAEALMPSILTQMARGIQYDGAYLGRYIQNWHSGNAGDVFDRHGWTIPAAFEDPAGEIWRMAYYAIGKNLNQMIDDGIQKTKWDYAGAGSAIKAWVWQTTTDYHGEIILKEAFKDDKFRFNYDSQEEVYAEVRRLCYQALELLNRTDGLVSQSNLAKGDIVYNGDRSKWIKFVYGLLARHHQHLSNKAVYKADSVIYYANLAINANADDFLVPFTGSSSTNANFYGSSVTLTTGFDRNRQSRFIVNLLDGTTFAGNTAGANRDPRMKMMLSRSGDSSGTTNGGFRGVVAANGDPFIASTSGANANKRVALLWGDALYGSRPGPNIGKYLFKDDARFPIMTNAEMQFLKAEAYWKNGEKDKALTAYRAGISAHLTFVTTFTQNPAVAANTITTAERNAYLANTTLVKNTMTNLTLQDIMLQKYIALWGWGFVETWVDMRRYHYTDENGGDQVYKGFNFPASFFQDNGEKPAYRFRPRWNSEFIWNKPALESIGALNPDYHTYEMWFSKP
jgi:hypothetical protein